MSKELPTSNQRVATVYRTGILVSPDGWQSEEREWVDADEYRFLRRRYDESVNHQQELNSTYERDVDQLHAEIERLRAALRQAMPLIEDACQQSHHRKQQAHYHRLLVEAGNLLEAAPPAETKAPTGWQPIASAPRDGRTLLLGYVNSCGRWRTLRGQWYSQSLIEDEWEEPENGSPGWYETSVENDDPPNCWQTEPTHWMPLPAPPENGPEGTSS
jgi:hypothetical protein